MTIAEYYTPNGRSINGKGVEPDVEVEYEYDENNPEADTQLEKALEVVKDQIINKTIWADNMEQNKFNGKNLSRKSEHLNSKKRNSESVRIFS